MLKAGGRAQSNSDQVVLNKAARSRGQQKAEKARNVIPAAVAIVGLFAAFAWWRRRQGGAGKRFTTSKGQSNRAGGKHTGLTRQKTTNNKKNKDRQKDERERRAEKRSKAEGKVEVADGDRDNTIILTSKFVDSSPQRSTTSIARLQKMAPKNITSDNSSLDPYLMNSLKGNK